MFGLRKKAQDPEAPAVAPAARTGLRAQGVNYAAFRLRALAVGLPPISVIPMFLAGMFAGMAMTFMAGMSGEMDAPVRVAAAGAAQSDEPAAQVKPAPKSAAERRRERAEAARLAAQERAAQEKRRIEQFNERCVIKPVMTDDEIDRCRPTRR